MKGHFRITSDLRLYYNHRLDTAYDGRYFRRLPDRSLVYADEYEERLKEWQERIADQEAPTKNPRSAVELRASANKTKERSFGRVAPSG